MMKRPLEFQVERACSLIAQGIGREWPDGMERHEAAVWRASVRSMLVIVLNQDEILAHEAQPTDDRTAYDGSAMR